MDKLKRIIGLAPSELTPEEFKERLQKERWRVTEALEEYRVRGRPAKKARKPKANKIPPEIQKILDEYGISLEEFVQMRKELKEEKEAEREQKD